LEWPFDKPFRKVLGPAALYIRVLDGLHFDLVGRQVFGKKRLLGSENAQPAGVGGRI